MIDEEKVRAYLGLYSKDYKSSYESLLKSLYEVKGLSLKELSEVTKGYASKGWFNKEVKRLNLSMRPRGGPNNKKS